MRYKTLSKSDLKVSVIGLGTWVMGGENWGKADDTKSIATIHKAIDSGINLIDTAPAYGNGHAEEIVGKAIRGKRSQLIIATKCGIDRRSGFAFNLKPEFIRMEIENSLKRLNIDAIDLYQCHWPDPSTPVEDSMNELLKMQSQGKIRYIGVSNFDVPLLEKAMETTPLVSVQPHYSLLERDIEKNLLPFCREKNIGVLTYGSIGGGILTGKYKKPQSFGGMDARNFFYAFFKEPYWSKTQNLISEMKEIAEKHRKPLAHIAINWVTQQSGITSALVGARTPEQIEINAGAGEWELSQEELQQIQDSHNRIFGIQ